MCMGKMFGCVTRKKEDEIVRESDGEKGGAFT